MSGWNSRTAGGVASKHPAGGNCDFRRTIHTNSLGSIENSSISKDAPLPAGYENQYQVALPYAGLFTYIVGRRRWHIDSNKTLLISPGRDFQDEHPLKDFGHACVLINPTQELIDEICGLGGAGKSAAFRAGSLRSTLQLQMLSGWILRNEESTDDILRKDEWIILALQEAVRGHLSASQRPSRIVNRAKEVLHEFGFDRISLTDVAKHVGVSPVYLTQEFTRCEGVPLYQYQLALRLSRALLELPHCEDITALALDLGFSSHSHFSSAFRRWYGLTPSAYRNRPVMPGMLGRKACHSEIRTRVQQNLLGLGGNSALVNCAT